MIEFSFIMKLYCFIRKYSSLYLSIIILNSSSYQSNWTYIFLFFCNIHLWHNGMLQYQCTISFLLQNITHEANYLGTQIATLL